MEEAETLADRVGILDRGRLVAVGSPERLAQRAARREISFTCEPPLDTVALSGALRGLPVRESAPGRYVIEGDASPQLIGDLARWLEQRGTLMSELRVQRPSLEDTYLRLTGSADGR
jgi:ABC-2 type transport system ATP-binding protein